jgi:hypothetical protein
MTLVSQELRRIQMPRFSLNQSMMLMQRHESLAPMDMEPIFNMKEIDFSYREEWRPKHIFVRSKSSDAQLYDLID